MHTTYSLQQALMQFIQKNDAELVDVFFECCTPKNFDVNYQNERGLYPIQIACAKGNLKIVDILAKQKANLFVQDHAGLTLLHYASLQNDVALLAYFVNKKLDVSAKTKDGLSALHLVAKRGTVEQLDFLLAHNAPLNDKDYAGFTPLATLIEYNACPNKYQLASHFLKRGANPNIVDNMGNSALHYACQKMDIEAIKLLLQNGANPFLKNNQRCTPLDCLKDVYRLNKGVFGYSLSHLKTYLQAEKMLLASEKKFPKLYQRNQQKLVALYALEQAKAEVRRLFSYHKICAQQRDYIPQPYVRTRAS